MNKNEVLKILETAKDKKGEIPMRLVRQAFEKLPEPCEDTISRRKAFEYFVTLWESIGTIMDRDEWEDVCMTTANEIPSAEPERTYKRGYADGYHKAEKDYFERSEKDRADAFKAGVETEKEVVRKWLLAYHGMSFDLKGRYLPHEVISWLVNDISKKLLDGGKE